VLKPAFAWAQKLSARLEVLTIIEDPFYEATFPPRYPMDLTPALRQYRADLRERAEQNMKAHVGQLDPVPDTRILAGAHPSRTIVRHAVESGADLIFLRTHGRTGFRRLVMGSVAELVVRHSPVPVLSMHSVASDAHPRHLLMPTDLSEPSFEALPQALDLADRFGARLTVLSVVEEPYYLSALGAGERVVPILRDAATSVRRRIHESLSKVVPTRMDAIDVKVEQSPNPAECVIQAAERFHCDLIVMATHGHSGLAHVVLGSTAEKVVRMATVPVLTLRERPASGKPS
jgi:nucleotide-binding universal stress UspA family protein